MLTDFSALVEKGVSTMELGPCTPGSLAPLPPMDVEDNIQGLFSVSRPLISL